MNKLDLILAQLGTTASFKNFDSKTELSGKKCELLKDYINNLENTKKEIKEYLINASIFATTDNEHKMIIELLKIIKESENNE